MFTVIRVFVIFTSRRDANFLSFLELCSPHGVSISLDNAPRELTFKKFDHEKDTVLNYFVCAHFAICSMDTAGK